MTLDALSREALARDLLDALADLGVVTVARHVHQTRVEAVVRIAPHEQSHRPPLVEIDHAAHDADEVGDPRLEQLIAQIGLEHVQHRLAVVAGRIQSEVLDDPLDFAPQHRNVARAAVIRGRGPKPEEPVLAVHPAALVEGLDAHVVEQLAAVNGRGRVGLGDDQELRLARAGAHVTAQDADARTPAPGPENPETRRRIRHQAVLGATALEPVVAVAEKYEVPPLHPVEEVMRLAHLRRRQRRRIALEPGDDLACPLAHRRPVRDRVAHVGEGRLEIAL